MTPHDQDSDAFPPLSPSRARGLRLLVIVAAVLFVAGIFTPMLTISQLVVISSSFSVYSGVVELLRSGHLVLFLVVTGFSIVIPVLKLWVLYRLTARRTPAGPAMQRMLTLMHEYGRWAMLDVMVVAVLIVAVKLGTIASLQVHYGLYLFGAAVLLIMLVTGQVIRLTGSRHG